MSDEKSFLLWITSDFKDCKDDNKDCEAWEKSGECKRNPAFMLKNCRKSCKECGMCKFRLFQMAYLTEFECNTSTFDEI